MHRTLSLRRFALRTMCPLAVVALLVPAAPRSAADELLPVAPAADPATVEVRVIRGSEVSTVVLSRGLGHLPVENLSGVCTFRIRPSAPVEERPDPAAWLAAFETIYEAGDSAAYAALLGENYRFVSGDAELERRFPEGFGRKDELSSYARLFRGVTAADGTALPAARRVDLTWQDVRVLPDPEFPDDPGHALVHVGRATLAIEFADGSSMRDTAPHAFWLELAGGEAGWVCRRWVERPAGEVLAALEEPPGEIVLAAASAPDPALAPAWAPFPNPARAGEGLSYAYEVAATGAVVALELFDVAGRRVAALDRGAKTAGRHVARWNGRNDAGRRVAPGVYFLSARVGEREERSRVIVVR